MEIMGKQVGGKVIAMGIIGAFVMLLGIIGLIGGLYSTTYIWGIVLGAIFQLTQNGSLPVTNGTINFLSTTETSFFSSANNVLAGANFASSLIPIGVVLIVFGGLIFGGAMVYQYYKGKKGGDSGKDLGY